MEGDTTTEIFSLFLCGVKATKKYLKLVHKSESIYKRPNKYFNIVMPVGRSHWPRRLGRRSAAARLLRLWVRIPPGAWASVVSVVCCQVEVSATSWSSVEPLDDFHENCFERFAITRHSIQFEFCTMRWQTQGGRLNFCIVRPGKTIMLSLM